MYHPKPHLLPGPGAYFSAHRTTTNALFSRIITSVAGLMRPRECLNPIVSCKPHPQLCRTWLKSSHFFPISCCFTSNALVLDHLRPAHVLLEAQTLALFLHATAWLLPKLTIQGWLS